MITGNEPAMPMQIPVFDAAGKMIDEKQIGLTIRQHFAAMNMAAYISSGKLNDSDIAEWSVKGADALITELNKPT